MVAGSGMGVLAEFGYEAGEFDPQNIVPSGEFPHACFPIFLHAAISGFRFGDVVDDHSDFGLTVYQLDGGMKLALEDEQVEPEVEEG